MGPRPFDRGKYFRLGLSELTGSRFNGAATIRSRKVLRPHAHLPGSWCFNGAATIRSRKDSIHFTEMHYSYASGPRPFDRGNIISVHHRSFRRASWGRDHSIAEIMCFTYYKRQRVASMGPRPFDRGNAKAEGWFGKQGRLQWGRDHSIAETPQAVPSHLWLSGLQWGRDHSIAETIRRRKIWQ